MLQIIQFHLLFFPVLPSRVLSCYTMSCSVMSYLVLSCPIQRSVESIDSIVVRSIEIVNTNRGYIITLFFHFPYNSVICDKKSDEKKIGRAHV